MFINEVGLKVIIDNYSSTIDKDILLIIDEKREHVKFKNFREYFNNKVTPKNTTNFSGVLYKPWRQ